MNIWRLQKMHFVSKRYYLYNLKMPHASYWVKKRLSLIMITLLRYNLSISINSILSILYSLNTPWCEQTPIKSVISIPEAKRYFSIGVML